MHMLSYESRRYNIAIDYCIKKWTMKSTIRLLHFNSIKFSKSYLTSYLLPLVRIRDI